MNQVVIGRADFSASSQRGVMRKVGSPELQAGDQIAESESAHVLFMDVVDGGAEAFGMVLGVSRVLPRGTYLGSLGPSDPDFMFQVSEENPDIINVTLPELVDESSPERSVTQLRVGGEPYKYPDYPFVFMAFASSQAAIDWYEEKYGTTLSASNQHFGPGIPQHIRYDW